jgi:hypothetical protein
MVGGSIYNKKGRHSHVPHTSQWSEEMFDESELCAGENSHIVYIYTLYAAAVQMPRTRTREISNLTDNHLVILGGKLCAITRPYSSSSM